jgi:hypothetical protein
MLETDQIDQIVFRVNMLDVLRTPVLVDWAGNLNLIQSASTFGNYIPYEEAPHLIQWNSSFANCLVRSGAVYANLNLIEPSTDPVEQAGNSEESFAVPRIQTPAIYLDDLPRYNNLSAQNLTLFQPSVRWSISPDGEVFTASETTAEFMPSFDCACSVVAKAVQAAAVYFSVSERKACLKRIFSSAVSKNGHLSFLVPRHRQVCLETAARDQVVHLEVITLAEEQEALVVSAVGQMLISGGKSWTRWRSRLSNLLSRFLRKTLVGGFTVGGLGFKSVEPLLLS